MFSFEQVVCGKKGNGGRSAGGRRAQTRLDAGALTFKMFDRHLVVVGVVGRRLLVVVHSNDGVDTAST